MPMMMFTQKVRIRIATGARPQSSGSGRIAFIKHWQRALTLDVNVHPRPLDLVCFRTFNPPKQHRASVSCISGFLRAIKMFVHAPTEIVSQTYIQDSLFKGS
jgi:hypothetical protein